MAMKIDLTDLSDGSRRRMAIEVDPQEDVAREVRAQTLRHGSHGQAVSPAFRTGQGAEVWSCVKNRFARELGGGHARARPLALRSTRRPSEKGLQPSASRSSTSRTSSTERRPGQRRTSRSSFMPNIESRCYRRRRAPAGYTGIELRVARSRSPSLQHVAEEGRGGAGRRGDPSPSPGSTLIMPTTLPREAGTGRRRSEVDDRRAASEPARASRSSASGCASRSVPKDNLPGVQRAAERS